MLNIQIVPDEIFNDLNNIEDELKNRQDWKNSNSSANQNAAFGS